IAHAPTRQPRRRPAPRRRQTAMSTTASFKQECPFCEARVAIRDPKLVGKKIDCPKCKGKFVVKAPPEDDEDEADKEEGITSKPAKKKSGGAITAKKPKKGPRDAPDAEGGDEDARPGKKKKDKGGKKPNTLVIGAVLAVVAVGALSFGAYQLWFKKPKKT